MTGMWTELNVEELTDEELGAALGATSAEESWGCRAAVRLIVEQGSWLGRWELRQAVTADVDEDGRIVAWVDWREVELDAPASGGELRILHLARSLGGIPSPRSLQDLVSLDNEHVTRVLRAIEIAARGWAS